MILYLIPFKRYISIISCPKVVDVKKEYVFNSSSRNGGCHHSLFNNPSLNPYFSKILNQE